MPMAIPLIAAYGAVSAGIAAGAATLIGGMMIAGGVLTAVGALTGNKKLQTFGSVLSLAGGVANLASTAVQETSSNLASAAAEQATAGTESIAAEGLGQTAAPVADAGATSALTESVAPGAVADSGGAATETAATAANAAPAATVDPMAGLNAGATADISAPAIEQATAGAESLPVQNGLIGNQNPSLLDKFQTGAQDLGKWAKANPELVKAGTGLISGAANAYGQQQQANALQDNLAAQQSYMDKLRQRYSDSVRNLQIPTFATQQPRGGIINGAKG